MKIVLIRGWRDKEYHCGLNGTTAAARRFGSSTRQRVVPHLITCGMEQVASLIEIYRDDWGKTNNNSIIGDTRLAGK